MNKVKTGDTVTVHYTGTLDNGDVFDSSRNEGREPFSFKVGANEVIPGFEAGLIGLAEGETKSITIEVADAYGEYEERMVFEAPLERLPEGVEVGTQLTMMSPQGPIPAVITSISEDRTTAKIDHNHPLAGQRLNFELEVLGINSTVEA